MAKIDYEAISFDALAKGKTDDGREYVLARTKGAVSGTIRTHILQQDEVKLIDDTVLDSVPVSGKGDERVWIDTETYDLGQGAYFNVPAPAPTIRVSTRTDGTVVKRPALTISGLLLKRRNDSLSDVITREMVNRCYNGQYLAVAGIDYSRWRLPELGEFTEYDKVLIAQLETEE